MLITTSYNPSDGLIQRSRQLASEIQAEWIARRQSSLQRIYTAHQQQAVLIMTEKELKYYPDGQTPIFFHPSTAQIRLKRLLRGEADVLINLSGVRAGDTVLDCTAGLGADSIVFSFMVGETGKVVAVESEPMLVVLLQHGLIHYESDVSLLNEAMRRIQVVQADHLRYLKSLPERSVDVVYFDPMFRIPVSESSAISPLREIVNGLALQDEAIMQAKRVARRRIVLKEHRESKEFERLGFVPYSRTHSKIAYGVIDL